MLEHSFNQARNPSIESKGKSCELYPKHESYMSCPWFSAEINQNTMVSMYLHPRKGVSVTKKMIVLVSTKGLRTVIADLTKIKDFEDRTEKLSVTPTCYKQYGLAACLIFHFNVLRLVSVDARTGWSQ